MKSLFLLLMATALVTTSAMAQNEGKEATKEHKDKDYKEDRAEWDKKVKNDLKLTPDQTTQYEAVCKEYNDKMDAVAQDASLNKDAQKEKKMALKKEKEDKLFAFLTPEQQTKYRQMADRKKNMTAKKEY